MNPLSVRFLLFDLYIIYVTIIFSVICFLLKNLLLRLFMHVQIYILNFPIACLFI